MTVLYIPSAARDRMAIRDRLSRAGGAVSLASDMPDALRMLSARPYGLVVIDLAAGEQSIATVRILRAQPTRVPIVGVMDPVDPLTAAEAVNAGVADLLPWPFDETDILAAFGAARDRGTVDLDAWSGDEHLYMNSTAMRLAVDAIRAAGSRKGGLLLAGPRGSGRALLARSRHALDDDYVNRPFVAIDCESTNADDLERRLFGMQLQRKAEGESPVESVDRSGAIVAAQGGSLLLENLVAAPPRVQARLAAAFRERRVFSEGAGEIVPLDVRLMATAEPDVDVAVNDGRLRRDLYEQVAAVRVDVPPFGRRPEDLPFLAMRFLRRACEINRISQKRFSRAALALIKAMPWNGNATELAAAVAAVACGTRQPVLHIEDVLEHVGLETRTVSAGVPPNLREARDQFERDFISRALVRHEGRVGDAAKELGMQRTNLYRKVRQLKVSKALLAAGR